MLTETTVILLEDKTFKTSDSEFHVYRMDWSESRLDFFVDDVRHHGFSLTENMPFHQPFFFILNVAMGGLFTDNTIDPNFSALLWRLITSVYTNKFKKETNYT